MSRALWLAAAWLTGAAGVGSLFVISAPIDLIVPALAFAGVVGSVKAANDNV